ncbi:septum formation inhibitor Maf [Halopseudomonas nanhaiensis]|uniref:Maf family protein n=1 Tax=Halopseudomonas nanhaiensis TaxID=2830842 RepID=UPI001CC135AF|nr:nucleoside triphosphate pyrophosphatase [Halopseudomonas nanhaiensis]UAW96961.1 septum formation inhibitor Maf [Halopseudomonas nanhaiensis]
MARLVLASGSPYRRDLLKQLGIPFEHCSPDVEEATQEGESAEELTLRLAKDKALAVIDRFPTHLIIASDQVALLDGEPVSKPGDHAAATRQLQRSSGQRITFSTSLCLLNSETGRMQTTVEHFHVQFRQLSDEAIERYLSAEKPYDCAGSFRVEGLGISLFSSLQGEDPNSLIGLPMIRLCDMLANEGVYLP